MKKCVIYARVSTSIQDVTSQLEDLRRYASNNEFKVVKEFPETVSGFDTSKERLKLDELKEYIKKNDIKQILTYELSRIGRSTLQTLKEIEYFRKEGVNIFCKKENINTLSQDATTKLLLSVLSSVAEIERDNIISRISRGHMTSVSKGKRTGLVTLPYGYKSDENGILVVDDEESKIVKMIYDLALKEVGYRGIARELNFKNIPTRWAKIKRTVKDKSGNVMQNKWKQQTVKGILTNILYKGERKYKDEVFPITPIIDKDIWDKVQEINSKKVGYNLKPTSYNYKLRSKIVCGLCGRKYLARTETRYGNEESFYYCGGARDLSLRCRNGQIHSYVLEFTAYHILLRQVELIKKLKEEDNKKFDENEKLAEIEQYKQAIKDNEERFERNKKLFREGDMSEKAYDIDKRTMNVQNDGYKEKIKNITYEIKHHTKNAEDYIEELYKSIYVGGLIDPESKKIFLEKYVDHLAIHKIKEVKISKNKLNKIEFKQMLANKQDRDLFKKLLNTKLTNRYFFLEIYAFGMQNPFKAILINNITSFKRKDDTVLCYIFMTPTLKINNGILTA